MVRSNGIPRGTPIALMSRVISARSNAVTFTRPTKTKGGLDQVEETTAEHTENVWLHVPEERVREVSSGEREVGDIAALAVADGTVDIQKDDRVTYGGVEYEVDSVIGLPEDNGSPEMWLVQFIRRQS